MAKLKNMSLCAEWRTILSKRKFGPTETVARLTTICPEIEDLTAILQWLMLGSQFSSSGSGGTIKDDDDSTSGFVEEDQMMKRQCHEYLANPSTVFGYEDKEYDSVTIHHSNQILADWQMITVAPDWTATEPSNVLQYIEPQDK